MIGDEGQTTVDRQRRSSMSPTDDRAAASAALGTSVHAPSRGVADEVARERSTVVAGAVQRRVGLLEQQSLLRIHRRRLGG